MRPLEFFRYALASWRSLLPARSLSVKAVKFRKVRPKVEPWDPVPGPFDPKELLIVMGFCYRYATTRDWRKMNLVTSYHPRRISSKQLYAEFDSKRMWVTDFGPLNKLLRWGHEEGHLPFRSHVLYSHGDHYLSKMAPKN